MKRGAGRGRQHFCTACQGRPAAFSTVDYCFDCWPGGPVVPLPCVSCGSRTQYFVNGLCHRCHRDGHPGVDSCRNCLAWGATRRLTWLCKGCVTWCAKYSQVADCAICHQQSTLDHSGVCRLCRKQGSFWREPREQLDLVAANRRGQQLFIADLFRRHDRNQPRPQPRPTPLVLPIKLNPHRQLVLFEVNRDLSARGNRIGGLAERADPAMAATMNQFVRDHQTRYGWRKDLASRVRTGVHVLLGFQTSPGDPITATEAAVLAGTDLPMGRVLDVFADAGLLVDDRVPAIETWFARQITGLPEQMTDELRSWFTILLDGSTTTPRRRPRTQITARLCLTWALPALHSWTDTGRRSLREISAEDVHAVLPPSGPPRSRLGQALRSIFGVLKARKVIFTNPVQKIKTGYEQRHPPLPTKPDLLRDGLDSPDPARALLVALVAFHGLRSGQVRHLHLTDIHDRRLHLDNRRIPLAEPVHTRLTAYLDYRTRTWPNTTNPHLFLTARSANGPNPPGNRWIKLKIDVPGATQAIREDRILHEAHATGGDIRRIIDLFGLSTTAAERYAATIDNPDLINPTPTPG